MNYKKVHDQIINRAKNREKPECYCENHHITPKSMGGTDDCENIATLTAREHFIIHWLLMKIHKNKQMVYAFHCMTKPVGNGRSRYTSHSFKYAREAMAKWISDNMSGENHPFYGLTGKNHPHYGMKRKKSTREKISAMAKKRYENSINSKAVGIMCLDTGETFKSITMAKKKHKKGNISYALKSGGTAGGLRFAYIDEETGNPVVQQTTLKGYARGAGVKNSVKITSDSGSAFDTAREAGESIGVTGSAVLISIKQGRACKGVMFYRGDSK